MKKLLLALTFLCALSCSSKPGDDPTPPPVNPPEPTSNIKIVLGNVAKSSYQIVLPFTITQTGGEKCKAGIVWSQTNKIPTISDNRVDYYKVVTVGGSAYGAIVAPEAGKPCYIRAFGINSKGVGYSEVMVAQTDAEPASITFNNWQPVTTYALPDEVKLYSVATTVDGKPIKMWYAVADLSTGVVEFIASKVSPGKTTTAFAKSLTSETVYIAANGGYFGNNASFSYVDNRGVNEAKSVASLSRSDSAYNVTRAVLGVDKNGVPGAGWSFNEFFYTSPLPVVELGPILKPTQTFPANRTEMPFYSAIGGGPMLVKDGRMCFDYLKINPATVGNSKTYFLTNFELMQNDIFDKGLLQPRTAIGYSADGKKMVILVADGRQPGVSEGLTLDNLARIMAGLGCATVMTLDGGGSTTMVATNEGALINTPSNTNAEQRAVISFVGFVSKK